MTTAERLFALALEAESHLLGQRGYLDVRDWLSIAHGALELSLTHSEPLDVQSVETYLARAANSIGPRDWSTKFLMRLRVAAAWEWLHAETDRAPALSS